MVNGIFILVCLESCMKFYSSLNYIGLYTSRRWVMPKLVMFQLKTSVRNNKLFVTFERVVNLDQLRWFPYLFAGIKTSYGDICLRQQCSKLQAEEAVNNGDSQQKRPRSIPTSVKLSCPATIICVEVVYFPEFEVSACSIFVLVCQFI